MSRANEPKPESNVAVLWVVAMLWVVLNLTDGQVNGINGNSMDGNSMDRNSMDDLMYRKSMDEDSIYRKSMDDSLIHTLTNLIPMVGILPVPILYHNWT